MDTQELRRRFTAALAGGMAADWYDPGRHDPDAIAARVTARPAVVSSSRRQIDEAAEAAAHAYTDRIRATARARARQGH